MNNFDIKLLTTEQKNTRRRILEISYDRKLSHIGSCLSSVDLIDAVYKVKKKNEKFVLSNGHAGIALYVILEKNGFIKDPNVIKELNIHPDRNPDIGIFVSTGSLGQGLPIALGMALASAKQNVYCMISDGECTEGSIWETLRIVKDNKINNLKIMINANGWSAYDSVCLPDIIKRLEGFGYEARKINGHNMKDVIKALKSVSADKPIVIFAQTSVNQFPFLKNQDAHYYIMNRNDYKKALDLLK